METSLSSGLGYVLNLKVNILKFSLDTFHILILVLHSKCISYPHVTLQAHTGHMENSSSLSYADLSQMLTNSLLNIFINHIC